MTNQTWDTADATVSHERAAVRDDTVSALTVMIDSALADLDFKIAEQNRVAVGLPTFTWAYWRREEDGHGEWAAVRCRPAESETVTLHLDVATRRKRWWE